MNRTLLIPTLFTFAACASSGPEPEQAVSFESPAPAQAAPAAAQAEPAPAQQEFPSASESASPPMVVQNDSAKSSSSIEDIDAPNVKKTPPSQIPGRVVSEPEPQVVCERVVPTGSILPVKVCRDRSEMARKEQYDQEMFEDIKRNTAIGNTRL